MGSRGPKPKPVFQVVREGNPGKRPIRDVVVLPPSSLVEPDWTETLDAAGAAAAHALWTKVATTLVRAVGLVGEQSEVLADYCLTWARIVENEKALTREGMLVRGAQGGQVKNARTTILNQYRSHLRSLVSELGLSPRAAAGIARPESSDEEDPFD